jgi:polysaccharide biosynthesis PFTS motif protein
MGIAIPVLSGILRAAGIRRLRRIMRGYRILRDSGRQALIGNIKRAMTIHPIDIGSGACRPLLFGAGTGAAELICRQLLLTRLAGLSLNRAVLHSLGRGGVPVNHALPAEWRTIMRDHGVPVASIRSFLLWHAFVWMMIGYGLLQMVRIVLRGMRTTCRGQAAPLGNRHVYFHALGKGHLPQPCRDGRSHDILTWYTQWDGRILEIDALCHDVVGIARGSVGQVPVVPVDGPVPALKGWASLGRFIGWGLMATTVAVWDHLRGRWWHAALLGQAAQAAQMRLQEPGAGAGDYLFHNSGWFNRPLWTYEAASSGSRIIFYFYSTNCELFERPGIPTPLNYGWQAMDWPHYLVWDDHQADFVRAAAGEGARTAIVGPIWFQTSAVE